MMVLYPIVKGEAAPAAAFHPIRELRVRCLSLSDSCRQERETWLGLVFNEVEIFTYTESGYNFLSLAKNDFDVLVVSGSDIRRMSSIVRLAQPMLHRRMCIGLINDGNAKRRAQLISAGADDVFSSKRMHPIEAIARIEAIRRRYVTADELAQEKMAQEQLLGRLCEPSRLTDRERRLLLNLCTARDNFVRYDAILRDLTDYHERIAPEYLKLIVCHLRRKLRPGVKIVARRGEGYQLEIPQSVAC